MAKEDVRNKRTKKELREALIAILEEKTFDKISVNEITSKALLSRITFYKHYKDKYDLLSDVILHFSEETYKETIGNESMIPSKADILDYCIDFLAKCLRKCSDHQNVMNSILSANNAVNFLVIKNIVEDIVKRIVNALATAYVPKYPTEVIVSFMVGAVANFITSKRLSGSYDTRDFDLVIKPFLIDMVTKGVLFKEIK